METQLDTLFDFYQNEIIAMDFGNTRVKTYIGGKFFSNVYLQPEWKKKLKEKILKSSRKVIIFYSSVYDQQFDEFAAYLGPSPNIRFCEATLLLNRTEKINYNHIKVIGTDRLLGLVGAKKHFEPPFIVLDCGTAVTVNVLDESDIVRGGAIFPGLYTSARALFDYTSSLEVVHFKEKYQPHCGTTTIDAIKTGLMCTLIGGLKEAVLLFEKELFNGKQVPIVITGGYGDLVYGIINDWREGIVYNKTLILNGIVELADVYAKPPREIKKIRSKGKKKPLGRNPKQFAKKGPKKPAGKGGKPKYFKKGSKKPNQKDGNVAIKMEKEISGNVLISKPVPKTIKKPVNSDISTQGPKKKRIPLRKKII